MRRRLLVAFGLVLALALSASGPGVGTSGVAGAMLATRLTDREFWQLSVDASEPNGYFRSDNLTSNELLFETVVPDLVRRARPGRVYLGVGPEQNFTYMAALRPSFVVIFDIRRGNLLLHLMYKALFEMARDRIEFVSLLFARPRPAGVTKASTATELFEAFGGSRESELLYLDTLREIEERLTVIHRFPLSSDDLDGIESIYQTFYRSGFSVRYSPTYDELMTATDGRGVERSYLASEAGFNTIKDLETRNLVVPVVGDFAGPMAIRTIGAYLRTHGAVVSAFYLSNVEQYLYQEGRHRSFCRNVDTLPLDQSSTFIRSVSGNGFGRGLNFVSSLGEMMPEVQGCR